MFSNWFTNLLLDYVGHVRCFEKLTNKENNSVLCSGNQNHCKLSGDFCFNHFVWDDPNAQLCGCLHVREEMASFLKQAILDLVGLLCVLCSLRSQFIVARFARDQLASLAAWGAPRQPPRPPRVRRAKACISLRRAGGLCPPCNPPRYVNKDRLSAVLCTSRLIYISRPTATML